MSEYFQIKPLDPEWEGLHWQVEWAGIRLTDKMKSAMSRMWEEAWKTGALRIAFAGERDDHGEITHLCQRFDVSVWLTKCPAYMALSPFHRMTAVAFPTKEQAEEFVDKLDGIIVWNLLKKDEKFFNRD